MRTLDDIAKKITDEENNLIAKAFTMQITKLLKQNGIIPIMTKTVSEPNIISEKNNYIFTKQFGVSFNELDCSEHDKEIYNKAIDDFVEKISLEISESLIWGMIADCFKYKNMNDTSDKIVDYVIDTANEIAEQLKEGETE